MQSFKAPTPEQVDEAVPLFSTRQREAYFFDRLENPYWIGPLAARSLFATAPSVETVEGGGTRHPKWAASSYLARMAKLAPEEVLAVLLKIKTENASVIDDMLVAAIEMAPTLAKKLVPQICQAVDRDSLWYGVGNATKLCVHLATGMENETAFQLAGTLFSSHRMPSGNDRASAAGYEYLEGLQTVASALLALDAKRFCRLLVSSLNTSIERREYTDSATGRDYSFVWRPTIEEHEENHDFEFASRLVGVATRCLEQGIGSGFATLAEILQILDEQKFSLFKRLSLHLIDEFAQTDPDIARKAIMNRSLLDQSELKHEYARMVGQQWDILDSSDQQTWLEWVDAGPTATKGVAGEYDKNDIDRAEWWKFERFHWIRDHLPTNERQFYLGMRAKHGEPPLADLCARITSSWGHESPIHREELESLPFAEVVRVVDAFIGAGDRDDITAVAAVFGDYVRVRAVECSAEAAILKGSVAACVSAFIGKMAIAVTAGELIDVGSVLALCKWLIYEGPAKRRESDESQGQIDGQPWQEVRNEVIGFVGAVCKADSDEQPRYDVATYRTTLWELVTSALHDSATSNVIRSTEDDPQLQDYLIFGINSPRGRAVDAALDYARWLGRQIGDANAKSLAAGFDGMPEVREFLDRQIAPENRTFEALSVIGARIGLIEWLDVNWLSSNAERLFDLREYDRSPSTACGWAAWNSFLVWVNPRIELYRLFKSQFEYAVEQSSRVTIQDTDYSQPMFRLGEHLVVLYGRGELNLDGHGLFSRFIAVTNPDIRRHAIAFVGISIERESDLPAPLIQRLMLLWESYWKSSGPSDAAAKPHAYLFGQWFSSGALPKDWSIERLEEFVSVVPMPSPENEVVPRLAKICETDIARSVAILQKIVDGDKDGWRIYLWRDSAREILESALKTSGPPRDAAKKLIDRLGRRGYLEFGSLLAN